LSPALLAAPTRATAAPFPSSMAALGDSITRAFDVCCFYGDHPSNSWATGGSGLDSIRDQLATFNFQFSAGDVSVLDYFHPDLDGQRKLAETTWAASWWPTDTGV
jgi:hypothetical protein